MKGVLILAHGSREKTTEDTLTTIIDKLKHELPDCIIEPAYLQFSEKNLAAGLDALVARGITDIKVIPYFLFSGVHIREDIPREINEYLADKRNISVTLGKTLGADERLAMVLADRVREAL
jgi:sirohydrochlorin cobaltochelatase